MFSTATNSSITIDALDCGTTDCIASLLRARRAVSGRRISPWPDYSNSRLARFWVWRPREAHSARTSRWIYTRRLQQQRHSSKISSCSSQSYCEIQNTKTSSLCTSPRRQTKERQSELARTPWVLRAVQRTQRVFSRHQTTTTAVGLGVCSHLCEHSKSEQQQHTIAGDVWRAMPKRMIKKNNWPLVCTK